MNRFNRLLGATVVGLLAISPGSAGANGWLESRPWQFDNTADKANKAAVLDLMGRKKGGYYDGFGTTNHITNTTNIGTQLNCTNTASATGNIADNGQVANSPDVENASGTTSAANGNASEASSGRGGRVEGTQSNDGAVSSAVRGSSTNSRSGAIRVGDSDLLLNNDQLNSGNQYASVYDSTACALGGALVRGSVRAAGVLN